MIVAKTNLWYVGGNSDKIYVATVEKDGTSYTVTGEWGRRGKNTQSQIKGTFLSQSDAMIAYNALIGSKTAKGYQITSQVA